MSHQLLDVARNWKPNFADQVVNKLEDSFRESLDYMFTHAPNKFLCYDTQAYMDSSLVLNELAMEVSRTHGFDSRTIAGSTVFYRREFETAISNIKVQGGS